MWALRFLPPEALDIKPSQQNAVILAIAQVNVMFAHDTHFDLVPHTRSCASQAAKDHAWFQAPDDSVRHTSLLP
jgi:hypothetical protein